MKGKITKLKNMIASNDANAMPYLEKLTQQNLSEDEMSQLSELAKELMSSADKSLSKLEKETAEFTIREQMGDLADIINFAQLSRLYFGKSKQWLYQRINGYKINGKTATFTDEERRTFNDALNDIKEKITLFTA